MISRHFLISLSMCLTVIALNIPKHDIQLPLLPENEGNPSHSQSQGTRVLLTSRESGSDIEHYVEIPLHTTVFPGVNVLSRLSTIEITTVTEQGRSVSQARLDRIICRITPKISAEEREAVYSGLELKVLPWFAVRDGAVQFEDSNSRWFLGGRAIESYECR